MSAPRVAVIGHVEWVTHARGALPSPGGIAHLGDPLDEPAGGGAVSACQAAALGADCRFFTALGDDDAAAAAARVLAGRDGLTLHAAARPQPQTRALSATGPDGDRAIAVVGPGLQPRADDRLPWSELASCDAAYFTGHDPRTLRLARAARVLVVTARRCAALMASGVRADVVVASASDADERVTPGDLAVAPGAIVWTAGAAGGRYRTADGHEGSWPAVPPSGPVVDSYGCGDSFAAGLTVGLARGWGLDAAIGLGARCGSACITGRGALTAQLAEPA